MARAMIESMCPFFIVGHVSRTIAFYVDTLGFKTTYQEPETEPFSPLSSGVEFPSLSRRAKRRRFPILNVIRR